MLENIIITQIDRQEFLALVNHHWTEDNTDYMNYGSFTHDNFPKTCEEIYDGFMANSTAKKILVPIPGSWKKFNKSQLISEGRSSALAYMTEHGFILEYRKGDSKKKHRAAVNFIYRKGILSPIRVFLTPHFEEEFSWNGQRNTYSFPTVCYPDK